MSRNGHLCTWLFVLAATIAAGCVLTTSVFSQNPSGNISSDQLPADCSAYASVPVPAEAESLPVPTTAPDCASYRSYRGIGRPVNDSEARACALKERLAQKAGLRQNPKEPTAWVVGGSLILADIYFNGAGVERNIPLAMRFACEFEERTAMLALPDITKLNGSLPPHGPFEFCDYAATTFTMNFCGGYAAQIEDDHRTRYYNSLKGSMTQVQRAAFDKLLAAEHAYIAAHDFEVDQQGTIRVIRTLGSERILENLFRGEIVHFERREWPALSASQIATADGLLQREYEEQLQRLAKQSKDDIEDGAVTAENLSKVETAWEAYREAWVAFARLRYPAAEAAVRAQITLDRYRLVKTIG
jgi:hypothetical protein